MISLSVKKVQITESFIFSQQRQVALVRGLVQLFLVEMVFLNYQQTSYLYNFKKQENTLAMSFC